MDLVRDTSGLGPRSKNHCSQTAEAYGPVVQGGHQSIYARFAKFGNGDETSDFDLYISWDDIERAIGSFAELGHPDAIRVGKAMKLAKAVAEYLA
jgi:hypothetical protein